MHFKGLLYLFLLLISIQAQAQVVNIESFRRAGSTSPWSGYTSLSFSLIKNKNSILSINSKIHLQYAVKKNLFLFVNDINFKQVNGKALISKGIQHLRYNYKFRPRIAWEAFAQSQYDEIAQINFRGLLGTGPRFKLSTSEKYKLYLGTLSMYEYERIKSSVENRTYRDIRNSTYFSFNISPVPNMAIISTTYFQPLYRQFSDYRLSSDIAIGLVVLKQLSLKIGFTYVYDTHPAIGVPEMQYKLTNGLTYTF